MTARLAGLAAILLLAGCAASPHSVAPSTPAPAAAAAPAVPTVASAAVPEACSGSADALPVTTDRGIGGTGISDTTLADRGIGGTGIGSGLGTFTPGTLRGLRTSERGGGGTGIVGVITGFPSLCIDGLTVALDRPVHVVVDGATRAQQTLRLGEVVAVEAAGPADDLYAVGIDIRHEVSGPVATVDAAGAAIVVAGQRVLLTPATRLAAQVRPGEWVTVSGLRDPEGSIRASRVDPRAPGTVQVAGVPRRVDGNWWIGALRLELPPSLVPGRDRIVVAGEYADGVLRVRDVSPDPLVPPGSSRRHLLVEGYPSVAGNEVLLANGLAAEVGPGFGAAPPADEPIILELVGAPSGELMAVAWRAAQSGSGADRGKPALPPQDFLQPAPGS